MVLSNSWQETTVQSLSRNLLSIPQTLDILHAEWIGQLPFSAVFLLESFESLHPSNV